MCRVLPIQEKSSTVSSYNLFSVLVFSVLRGRSQSREIMSHNCGIKKISYQNKFSGVGIWTWNLIRTTEGRYCELRALGPSHYVGNSRLGGAAIFFLKLAANWSWNNVNCSELITSINHCLGLQISQITWKTFYQVGEKHYTVVLSSIVLNYFPVSFVLALCTSWDLLQRNRSKEISVKT